MSTNLKVIAVKFPINQSQEHIKHFFDQHNRLKYKQDLLTTDATSQIIYLLKKYKKLNNNLIETVHKYGQDQEVILILSTELIQHNLNKGKTRGDEQHKGRPKRKQICQECKTKCEHQILEQEQE